MKRNTSSSAQIKVIGVGGGGCNAIARMIQVGISGVSFIALDTDTHKLRDCPAEHKLAIGQGVTHGLGAGGDPDRGREAAEQSHKEIQAVLDSTDMVFITATLGGGTGTGAASVVAEMAKNMGILTLGVATTPFDFERQRRMQNARTGLTQLRDRVDALITIHNQRLFQLVDRRTPIGEAFALTDDILRQGVQGVSELITVPGTINVDFADMRTILKDAGPVLMGTSTGPVDRSAEDLVQAAVSSPLLENGITGATDILLNVSIGSDGSLHQVNEIAEAVAEAAATRSPNVIFGTVINDQLRGKVKLIIIATRFQEKAIRKPVGGKRASASTQVAPGPAAAHPGADPGSSHVSLPTAEREGLQPVIPQDVPAFMLSDDGGDVEMPTFVRKGRQRKSQRSDGGDSEQRNGQKDNQESGGPIP